MFQHEFKSITKRKAGEANVLQTNVMKSTGGQTLLNLNHRKIKLYQQNIEISGTRNCFCFASTNNSDLGLQAAGSRFSNCTSSPLGA